MGLVGVSFHDQTFNGPVTGRRWKNLTALRSVRLENYQGPDPQSRFGMDITQSHHGSRWSHGKLRPFCEQAFHLPVRMVFRSLRGREELDGF